MSGNENDIKTWIEERKTSAIYEPIGQVELPGRMLEWDEINKRESEHQAQLNICLENQIGLLHSERAKDIILKHLNTCRIATISVDGKSNSRNMLLTAIGKQAVVDQEKKKQGIAGILGGKN